MTFDPNKLEEASIEELIDYLKNNSDDALNSKNPVLHASYTKAIELLAQKVDAAEESSAETADALETIDEIAEKDFNNYFPVAVENYTKHHFSPNFTEKKDGNHLLNGFDDINKMPAHLVQKVWDDIMYSIGETTTLDEYRKKGNKDLSLMPDAYKKLEKKLITPYNAEPEHSDDHESDPSKTPDEEPGIQEMMDTLTNDALVQNWLNGDKDAEEALNNALFSIKSATSDLAVAPEALKKQLQPIANNLAEKGLEEAFSLYNKHKDKSNYTGLDTAEAKFNLKGFPKGLQDKIIADTLKAIGGGVKKEDIIDKVDDTIVGLKLNRDHSDALKPSLTANASANKSSSNYTGFDSFLNDTVAKSWEKTWDSFQKNVLAQADPLDMGIAFCEGLLLMPFQNLATMMVNFDEWVKNRNLRLSEDKWAKWNSKEPFNNNAGDNPSDKNNPNGGNGGNGGNGTVINIYGPVIGSNLNFGNQNGANIMIGGYDLQQALNAGVSLEALMKGNVQLAPQDARVLGLINSAAAILQFKEMYLKNLYRDSAQHPDMRKFAEKLEAIWNDPNFKGMEKLEDLHKQHPDLGKQMNVYLADMLADPKNAKMFKLLSETKIIPAEALQALTLLGRERQSGQGKENPEPEKKVVKNVVKMPDLSKLRDVYQKGSSEEYDAAEDLQLIATLKEGLSEKDLEHPIVKEVLAAYAKKNEANKKNPAERKEALSKLNDMVKTKADLAIAQKIAQVVQYDKPFDVPEIEVEHELSSPEPKVLEEKLENGNIRTITEKDGFKLIETRGPDGSLRDKTTYAPDGTSTDEHYRENGSRDEKITHAPDGMKIESYFEDGVTVMYKRTYTSDRTDTSEKYRKDGSLDEKTTITADATSTREFYHKNGSLSKKVTETLDGTKITERYYKGSLSTKSTQTPDGTLISENYNENGLYLRDIYALDGTKTSEKYLIDGRYDSKTTYGPDGNMISSEDYKADGSRVKHIHGSDGTKITEFYREDGSPDRKVTETLDGTKITEFYREGGSVESKTTKTPDGPRIIEEYREDGSLRDKTTYAPDGMKIESYFEDGVTVMYKRTYTSDRTDTSEKYRKDGSLDEKTTITADATSTREFYHKNGSLDRKVTETLDGTKITEFYREDGSLDRTVTDNKKVDDKKKPTNEKVDEADKEVKPEPAAGKVDEAEVENKVQTEPKYPEGGIVVDNTQKDGSVVKRIFYPKQKKIIELVQGKAENEGVTSNGLWTVTEYWPDLKKAKRHTEWMSADGKWEKQPFPEYGENPSAEVKDSQGNVSKTVWLTDKEINRLKKDIDRAKENNAKKPEPEKKEADKPEKGKPELSAGNADEANDGKPEDSISITREIGQTTHTTEANWKNETITFSYDSKENKSEGFCSYDLKNKSITMQLNSGNIRTFTQNKDGQWYSAKKGVLIPEQQLLNDRFEKASKKFNQLQNGGQETILDKLTKMQTPDVQEISNLLNVFKGRQL